jgi:hypothetical protein
MVESRSKMGSRSLDGERCARVAVDSTQRPPYNPFMPLVPSLAETLFSPIHK